MVQLSVGGCLKLLIIKEILHESYLGDGILLSLIPQHPYLKQQGPIVRRRGRSFVPTPTSASPSPTFAMTLPLTVQTTSMRIRSSAQRVRSNVFVYCVIEF